MVIEYSSFEKGALFLNKFYDRYDWSFNCIGMRKFKLVESDRTFLVGSSNLVL